MKKESTPNYAFGIKHSPYVGRLKGDEWVHARTEVVTPPAKTVTTKTVTTNGHATGSSGSSNKVVSQSVSNGGTTTSTTRTHSDGTKIRTALEWLIAHCEDYRDIKINEENLAQYPSGTGEIELPFVDEAVDACSSPLDVIIVICFASSNDSDVSGSSSLHPIFANWTLSSLADSCRPVSFFCSISIQSLSWLQG